MKQLVDSEFRIGNQHVMNKILCEIFGYKNIKITSKSHWPHCVFSIKIIIFKEITTEKATSFLRVVLRHEFYLSNVVFSGVSL